MKIGKTIRLLAAFALAALCAVYLLCASALADVDNADRRSSGDSEMEVKGMPEEDYHGKTVILHSNDVNGAVDGYARMAWLKQKFERLGAETILADAGNSVRGSIHVSGKGAAAMALMNLTGYDVAALGRYDFTYGYDAMKQNLRRAAFPFLCANAAEYSGKSRNGEAICTQNYSYTTKSGLTIGFFGLLTPHATPNTNVDSDQTRRIEILKRRDIYRCVQEQVDMLRQSGDVIPGADLVIALSNVGSIAEHTAAGYTSMEIISKVEGLDLILDGGSGSVMTAGANGEAVQSCGSEFAYIGVVVIDDATKAIEDRWLIAADDKDLGEDATVKETAELLQARFKAENGTVFARSEIKLNGEASPGVRTEETNLGDLLADALVWSAKQSIKELTEEDSVIAISNGAGIRASIPAGSITRNHISAAFPFANTLSVVYITGAELLEVLEASTWCLPDYANSYPQSSGVVFTLDERIPYDEGDFYPNSQYRRPASIRRVTIESVQGQAFDPNAVYAVATSNYCAAGGDSYYLFANAKTRFDTDTSLEQALTDYIRYGLGGVITDAKYGQPRGDHTLLKGTSVS